MPTNNMLTPDFTSNNEFLCTNEHIGLIAVQGDDATSFLQSQLSNDIHLLNEHTCQLSSYSNPKGRMFSIFNIIQFQQGYLIILPISQLESVLQRLNMFIIMAKVTLHDVSEQWARFGIQCAQFSKQLDTQHQVTHYNSNIYIRLNPNNHDRFLILTPHHQAQSVWDSLKEQYTVTTENAWFLAMINEGIPMLSPATSEAFVLQMANLQLLNGVSFKKGCFPGQEIVARTRYLGKVKRRLFHGQIESQQLPEPGDELVTLESNTIDGSGKVVLAARSSKSTVDFLFIATIEKAENNLLKLLSQSDKKINLKELPYSLEES